MQTKSFEWVYRQSFILLAAFTATAFTGMATGSYLARKISSDTISLVHKLPLTEAQGIAHLFVLLLPLILTAVILRMNFRPALIVLLFFKSFSFSFCSCSLLISFPIAGWLLRSLIMFSDAIAFIAYLWLWLRGIVFHTLHPKKDLIICSVFLLLIHLFDQAVISPFTTSLFIH